MRRSFPISLLCVGAVCLLMAAAPLLGQAQRGSITVTAVNGADGQPLPGVLVSASSEETLTRRTALTDDQGRAVLVSLDPAAQYTVTAELEGFNGVRFEATQVSAGQDTALHAELNLRTVQEQIVVTSEAPLVDMRSATAGQDITLQLTESLPTARTYQDYLQLVPGVQDSVDAEGNPASRSGVNYRDRKIGGGTEGQVGRSSDNAYYFDGVNTTDNVHGVFGADINTEIIQEQSVLTGGLPAEFVGVPGLVSNVVTKSGGNRFSGSINYYFQDDSLVADNKNFRDQTFSRYDTAATLGGPIVQDKAWFFASYRNVNREDEVVNKAGDLLRTVESDADQGFAKVSWAITEKDLLSGVFLSDPSDRTGLRDNTVSNAEDFARDGGGERWSINYNRVFGAASLEVSATDHEADLNDTPRILEPLNRVAFDVNTDFSQEDETLGGSGDIIFETRGNEAQRASLEYLLGGSWGDHAIKGGVEIGESFLFEDQQLVDDAEWLSIANQFAGVSLWEVDGTIGDGFSAQEFTSTGPDEIGGINETLASHPDGATVYAAWDDDGDGFISGDELGRNMIFLSTLGNPNGRVNYFRDLQVARGPRTMRSEFTTFYLQDTWQWQRFSANVGLRVEEYEHFAALGESIIKFDTEYAPRVSFAWDLKGDGRQRLSFFYGDYYDAVRNNMTDFAGSNTGRITEEQVWVEPIQQFVTYRTRGGPDQLDGFFAPSIQTPVTTEMQLGYKTDLGRSMSFEVNLIDRETKDVLEDFGPGQYFFESDYPGPINDPNSLFLGEDYLGFEGAFPEANFFIATLPSAAFRDYKGVELVFRKRYSNHWQAIASYNYADQDGNTISDSNADGAGDVLWLDPRAPNMTATLPGLVEHLFKAAASYNWDNGLQVGGTYRWNSGIHLNTSETILFDRSIPLRVDEPFDFAGITNQRWVAPGAVGSVEGDSYGVLDLRVSYLWSINDRLKADFFVDVFNALDEQDPTRVQDLVGGGDDRAFGEGLTFLDPRRFFLGARLRF